MGEPHVVSALRAKHAELAGEIEAVEKRIAKLRADLAKVDGTLLLFDSNADPDAIPAKRLYRPRGWFSDGELPRLILNILRTAQAPMSVDDIADRVMAHKEFAKSDANTRRVLCKSIQNYLRRRYGTLVWRSGRSWADSVWRVM